METPNKPKFVPKVPIKKTTTENTEVKDSLPVSSIEDKKSLNLPKPNKKPDNRSIRDNQGGRGKPGYDSGRGGRGGRGGFKPLPSGAAFFRGTNRTGNAIAASSVGTPSFVPVKQVYEYIFFVFLFVISFVHYLFRIVGGRIF